ncbi:site-2 protease family protein [Candidatus Saccharibacteria bacterium]|nr:site-2 protease family protein [Candidatus Saccharibacteria bacterium]
MALTILLVLLVILISMTLHEIAHGYAAYALGDDTAKEEGRLSFDPRRHLDPVMSIAMPIIMLLTTGVAFGGAKPVPIDTSRLKYREWGFALVALAGPATNLVLAFIGYLLLSFLPGSWLANPSAPSLLGEFLVLFTRVNLAFMAFNILPIPPLDGSRILYAIAPDFVRRGMEQFERYGFIILLLIVFLAGGILWVVIGQVMQLMLDLFQLIV